MQPIIKNGFKDVWDCSILGRAEKDLIVNPNMKNLKTTFTQDIKDISEQEKKTAEFLKAKKEIEAKQGLNLSSQNKGNKFANLKKEAGNMGIIYPYEKEVKFSSGQYCDAIFVANKETENYTPDRLICL